MTHRFAAVIFRLVLAAASLGAMAFQLFAIHIPSGYNAANFFSYFTNLSNILISVVFIITAVRVITGRSAPTRDTGIRGAAVVYIAFVGLVFNTLLRDVELGDLIPWVNAIVHFIIPIAVLLDWVVWPPRNRLPLRVVPLWMIFPVVYVAYSLIRGAITGFYPYPFFNPAVSGGYGGVALYCLVMVVGFVVLALLVRWLGNLRSTTSVTPSATNLAVDPNP